MKLWNGTEIKIGDKVDVEMGNGMSTGTVKKLETEKENFILIKWPHGDQLINLDNVIRKS